MNKIEQHTTIMLTSDSPDAWKTAGPVTEIADLPYPFVNTRNRPSVEEVSG